ncbi:neuromedin-K receptor-like [Glandiceps talaboti]
MSSTVQPSLEPTFLPYFNGTNWNWDAAIWEIVLLSFLYGIISFLSVFGNTLVIFVILRNKKMWTITNSFLVNLSMADIVLGCFAIPFQYPPALLGRWPFGDFMCGFVPFTKQLSVFVSIGTLTVISIDRYFAVCHPLRRHTTPTMAGCIVVIIWVNAICTAMPLLINSQTFIIPDREVTGCIIGPTDFNHPLGWEIYHCYVFVTSYAVPLVVITIAYTLIAHKVWFQKTPGESNEARDEAIIKNKRKVIKMVMVIIILFAVCWLPLQLYDILKITEFSIISYKHIDIIWYCSNWLAMSNSACNPFVYGLLNDNFKREYAKIFKVSKHTAKVYPPRDGPNAIHSQEENVRSNGVHRQTSGTHIGQINAAINQAGPGNI